MTAELAAQAKNVGLPRDEVPTRLAALLFRAKVLVHQVERGWRDRAAGLRRFPRTDDAGFPLTVGQSRTPLWSDMHPAERGNQLGKVHNLRRAAAALDGIVVPAGEVFSFWRQVGRASRRRGYVSGRMLQQGCLVPAVGGGLCQLSNALYDAALRAGCEIVERHPHSRIVPGSAAAAGRDATVAWNYVDLRFRADRDLRIAARVERHDLVVEFRAVADTGPRQGNQGRSGDAPAALANSCATCGETSCFRHERIRAGGSSAPPTAYLVDENWPEFRTHLNANGRPGDVLGLPLDGERWHLARYRWETAGFARVGTASRQAIGRALAMRRLPAQGALRRGAEIAASERIARRLARLLTADVEAVCVAQSLLPFLWRDGHLGGREVTVLMTRLPLGALQARLDAVLAVHPERATLGDFRAPEWLVEAEARALDYASRIITPHSEIAALFPDKAVRLDWQMPSVTPPGAPVSPRRIAFPGPTVARKGAFELRKAAQALDLEIVLVGSDLEGPDFWDGIATRRADPASWLDGVAAVVQPALVEERPRHLLAALAAGVPVVATPACGIAARPGLTLVPSGDAPALVEALRGSASV